MGAICRVEWLKLLRSPVGVIGSLALIVGVLVLLGGITVALVAENPEVTAKVGTSATLDWSGLFAMAAQITAAGGLLGLGVVLAWMFGREFADGTIAALFALPFRRSTIALAKILVYAVWAVAISVVLTMGILGLGLISGYGAPSAIAWAGFGRQVLLTLLTALLAVPVAWIATASRSVLAAVGGAIALVVIGQVGTLAGAGGWMPYAAPVLWAMNGGADVSGIQLALPAVVALAFTVLSCVAWDRLQLIR